MNGFVFHAEIYRERFSPLFDFSEKEEIFSLVKNEKGLSQKASLFNRMFKADATLKQNQSHFKHLFQKWRENLDESLEEVRYDTENLKLLQTLFQSLKAENKFFIIKERLKENELYSDKVKKAFKQFKKLIVRTINTPSLEDISHRTLRSGFLSSAAHRNYSGLLLGLKSVNMLSQSFIFEKEQDEISTGAIEDHHREAKLFCPAWGLNWEEKLSDAFKKLKSKKETVCFARTLDQMQVLSLINRFYEDCEHQLKLASLMLSLKGEVFLAVAISLSEKIHSLNHLLIELKNNDPQGVDELLISLRENFIFLCNSMRNRIDIYCKKFRKDVQGHRISYKDIQEIDELLAQLNIIIEAIQATKILLHNVIEHPETKHIVLVDLQKDYERYVRRLTEKSTQEEHGGSIFPIIYRNVFERVDLADEEPAFEMLANWSLCHPSEYFEHGIFGDIPIQELDLESKESKTHLFKIAEKNLYFLGLETVSDLKKHHIFNRNMLSEFIGKRKVQAELAALTREQLHSK